MIKLVQWTRILASIKKAQFAVDISDIPVTLKQSQCHQTFNENVHPKQDYNHAKFERPRLNSVPETANIFSHIKQSISYLPMI